MPIPAHSPSRALPRATTPTNRQKKRAPVQGHLNQRPCRCFGSLAAQCQQDLLALEQLRIQDADPCRGVVRLELDRVSARLADVEAKFSAANTALAYVEGKVASKRDELTAIEADLRKWRLRLVG